MKFLAPALVLTGICAVAALALAAVHASTAPVIAEQERLFTLRSIKQAIPPYDNEPDQDVALIDDNGSPVCVYRGRQGDEVVGVAFEWVQGGGYSGDVKVLVGISPEGQVACADGRWLGVQILQHAETPGLGARMTEEGWRRQFCGRSLGDSETSWRVRKDGGEIDQLTGATITSRVISEALQGGLRFFQEHRQAIVSAEPGRCGD